MALPILGILLVLAAGAALRFVYPTDFEWKGDERWTFDHSQLMRDGGAWPWVGMPTSLGTPNPGMSLWVFAGLAALFKVGTPPELARAVASLNVIALLAFVFFAFAALPKEHREPWLWAAAMWAVNPMAVVFERKIWPPCVLPLGTVAFIAAWHFRQHIAVAFAWGLLGALMSQIHISAACLHRCSSAGTARFRAKGQAESDLGLMASQSTSALQENLADVALPPHSDPNKSISGGYVFPVPAATR
jgi:hypothetical protein